MNKSTTPDREQAARELIAVLEQTYPDSGPPAHEPQENRTARRHYANMKGKPVHGAALDQALDAANECLCQLAMDQRAEARLVQDQWGMGGNPEFNMAMDALDHLMGLEQGNRHLQAASIAIGSADREDPGDPEERNLRCRLLVLRGTAQAAERLAQDAQYAASVGGAVHMVRNNVPDRPKANGGAQACDAILADEGRVFEPFIRVIRRECLRMDKLMRRD